MASTDAGHAGFSSVTNPQRLTRALWLAAVAVAACYGAFLVFTALRLPSGAELAGQFWLQPAVKAAPAVLLAAAALTHPVATGTALAGRRTRRVGGRGLSAGHAVVGAVVRAGARRVSRRPSVLPGRAAAACASSSAPRLTAAALVVAACVALLIWFWPKLVAEGMTVPVTVYIAVLGAMVCAALLARLPTPWTALGAVCFAVSDAMIGINKFVLGSETLAVPIWWVYATSLVGITAGFFFGRTSDPSARR